MGYSLYLSFTEWDFMSPTKEWVGFANYSQILTDEEFRQVLGHTIYFSVGTVVLSLAAGLLLAVLLNEKLRGSAIYRALIFSPWITPTVAASLVWIWIYEPRVGLANWLLSLVGLHKLDWLGSERWAMPAIILFSAWKGMGYSMVYFLAGLQSIPSEFYEAAEIDGASWFSRFRHVTLPLLSPVTFFLLVVSLIGALNVFDQIQVLTQGGPSGATRTIVYYLYQNGFEFFNMGYGSAVAIVLLLITLALTLVQFRVARRWVYYE
jgi:multiple sugar transport system permease protein